jgi:hypothetical protein
MSAETGNLEIFVAKVDKRAICEKCYCYIANYGLVNTILNCHFVVDTTQFGMI